jgi:predicted O-methyltransferase YrrM
VPLPRAVRRLAPDRLRYSVRLRALAVGSGLVPPRTMHSAGESALLAELARDRRTAVEIGVYEGSSAVVLVGALPLDAALHLIDPFGASPTLLAGWAGVEGATRRVVSRAVRRRGGDPRVTWHVERSEDTAARWREPVDLVFIDGDHSEAGCRRDWELWSPFIAPHGIVLFHDAVGPQALPGPRAVVDGLFRAPDAAAGWRIRAEVDTAVAVERASGADNL